MPTGRSVSTLSVVSWPLFGVDSRRVRLNAASGYSSALSNRPSSGAGPQSTHRRRVNVSGCGDHVDFAIVVLRQFGAAIVRKNLNLFNRGKGRVDYLERRILK